MVATSKVTENKGIPGVQTIKIMIKMSGNLSMRPSSSIFQCKGLLLLLFANSGTYVT